MIAKQVATFGDKDLLPPSGVCPVEVQRYLIPDEYTQLGEAAFEQILLDQLGKNVPPFKSLETPPDHITLGRFHVLFEHCLDRTAIDLNWPNDKQIATFWESESPYLALLRNGKYESMLKRETAERFIMKRYFFSPQASRAQEPNTE